jgi:hypothetical protein
MSYEDIPPDVMQELLAQYAASQGDPSMMMTGEQQNFYGAIPSYDLKGDPYSLTSQFNQLQDFNQLIADPVMQSLGGVGSWGQEAFQPEVQWEQVDSPEYRRWRNYLNTPNSFEGLIAAEIQDGGTPYSAIQKIQARVAENPTGPLAQEIGMNFGVQDFDLGGYLKDEAGNTQIDWGKVSEAATSIDELRAKIPDIGPGGPVTAPDGTVVPGSGEIVEADGQLLRRTEVPSPLMEKFRELGLPSPYEEYTPEMLLGPDWSTEPYAGAVGQEDVARQAMRDAYQQMLDAQNAPARPAPRVSPGVDTTVAAAPPNYDVLSSGWPGSGTSISQAGEQNTATVAQPEGAPLAPSTDILDVTPGGEGMPAGSVQPAPGTPAAAVSEVIALGDDSTLKAWMDSVYPTLSPQDQAEVDVIVQSNSGGGAGNRPQVRGLNAKLPPRAGRKPVSQGEPPDEPTPIATLLGLAPQEELPPLDPNAPVMEASGGVGPTAPQQPEPPPLNVGNFSGSPFAPNMPAPQTGLGGTPGYVYSAGRYNEGLPQAETSSEQKAYLDYLSGGMMRGEVPPYPFQQYQQPPPLNAGNFSGSPFAPNMPAPREMPNYAYGGTAEPATPEMYEIARGEPSRLQRMQELAQQRALERIRDAGAAISGSDAERYQGMSDLAQMPGGGSEGGQQIWEYLRNATARPRQTGRREPMDEALARLLPGGTGPITEENYGGGPLPPSMQESYQDFLQRPGEQLMTGENPQIAQYLENARRRPRRSGAIDTGESRSQPQRDENVPKGVAQWLTNAQRSGWRENPEEKVYNQRRQQFRQAWLQLQDMRHQTYGAEEGYARGLSRSLRERGITPLQQAMAQRVQNIRTAGANVGASPQVERW